MRLENDNKLKADYIELINSTLDSIPSDLLKSSHLTQCVEALRHVNVRDSKVEFNYPQSLIEYVSQIRDLYTHWNYYVDADNKKVWELLLEERIAKKIDELNGLDDAEIKRIINERQLRDEQVKKYFQKIAGKKPPQKGEEGYVDNENPIAIIYAESGNDSYFNNDYVEAISQYSQAISLNPQYALAYFNRGASYYVLKDYDHAIDDFTEAVRLNPQYTEAYNNRGGIYFIKHNYQQALYDFQKAIEVTPEYSTAHNNCASAFFALGDYEQCLQYATRAIELQADDPMPFVNRAAAYLKLEDYSQTIADCCRAITLKANYAPAYYARGIAYFKQGSYELAINDFKKTIQLCPHLDFVQSNLERAIILNQKNNISLFSKAHTSLNGSRKDNLGSDRNSRDFYIQTIFHP